MSRGKSVLHNCRDPFKITFSHLTSSKINKEESNKRKARLRFEGFQWRQQGGSPKANWETTSPNEETTSPLQMHHVYKAVLCCITNSCVLLPLQVLLQLQQEQSWTRSHSTNDHCPEVMAFNNLSDSAWSREQKQLTWLFKKKNSKIITFSPFSVIMSYFLYLTRGRQQNGKRQLLRIILTISKIPLLANQCLISANYSPNFKMLFQPLQKELTE